MASVPVSNSLNKQPEEAAFREIALLRFTRPEDLAALRHLGDLLLEMAGEAGRFWPRGDEPFFRADLRAAAADLRHVSGFLADTFNAYKAGQFEVEPEEEALIRFAGKAAAGVARLADSIEHRLQK